MWQLAQSLCCSSSSPVSAHNKLPMTVVHYHCNPNHVCQPRAEPEQQGAPADLGGEPLCLSCAVGDLGVGTIFLIILSFSAAAYFLLGNGLSPISNPNLTTYKMLFHFIIMFTPQQEHESVAWIPNNII